MSSSKLSSLPFQLVEEILCRVPIESLSRFKTVCKQWYTLFNEKRFIYKLLDLAKEKRFIQVHHKSVQFFKLEPEALLPQLIPDELQDQIVSEAIHCDGLLLLSSYRSDDKSQKLAVWNPFLSRVKLIEPSSSYAPFDVYGFGYDNVSRDNYKILRINSPNSEIEIYEFKSKLWRSLEVTLECSLMQWKYVSMNGNMYWIAHNKMVNSEIEFFIQRFDFSTESFKSICCVPKVTDCFPQTYGHIILSGFGGDRLSLLQKHKNVEKIEVWITNKVTDDIVSWSKFFNVDGPDVPILGSNIFCTSPTCSIHKTKKIMLWCEEVDDKHIYAKVYEMGEGQINKLVVMTSGDIPTYYYRSSCHVYVPSLVPVPE